MELTFDRALVTGGAGFIGSHLVDALVSEGCHVHVLDNFSTGNLSNLKQVAGDIRLFHGDIRDREILAQATENCEIIFHLAAVVSVPQTVEHPVDSAQTNDMGTLYVLEAARQKHVRRVILSSSCAVYGNDPQLPKTENMIPEPCSPYAVQKLNAEQYARIYHQTYGSETVSLRYFNVYGPRQDPSSLYSGVISIFITRAFQNQPPVIYGDGNQSRDFVFVKDVVKANFLAATSHRVSGKVFNIGTGSAIRINQLWDMICEMSAVRLTPTHAAARSGDILHSLANIDLARTLLGFEPDYSFRQGLEQTMEWYRRIQKTEDRLQRTEDREQKAEDSSRLQKR